MKPPIPTPSPVWTRIRVERLLACAGGIGVGLGVGVELGVGEGVEGVGVGVVAGRTVVDALEELLPGLGSIALAEAPALVLSVPATIGVTTTITVAVPEPEKSPKLQKISLVPTQLPRLGVTETKFTPAGKCCDIVTFGAPPGPRTPTPTVIP